MASDIQCCSLQTDLSPPELRKWRRIHGLQRPLHPQQIIGWILLIIFVFFTFLLLIPIITTSIVRNILYIIMYFLFIIHIISHIISLMLDPAELELRKIPHREHPIPEFDRTKHAHVIEEGRCHLCNIIVTNLRTKHCSACNKCVANFDHHCKWLNHCIGSRNYYPFLVCVFTAGIASLLISILSFIQLTFFYVFPQYLQLTNTFNIFNDNILFPIICTIIAILSLVTAVLLLHLFAFHIYIAINGITTYEYIRHYRYYSNNRKNNKDNNCKLNCFKSNKVRPDIKDNNPTQVSRKNSDNQTEITDTGFNVYTIDISDR